MAPRPHVASVWRRPFGRRVRRGRPSRRRLPACFSLAAALRPPGPATRLPDLGGCRGFSLAAALRPPGRPRRMPAGSSGRCFSLAAALRPPGRGRLRGMHRDDQASVWRRPFGRRVGRKVLVAVVALHASVWRRPFGRRVAGTVPRQHVGPVASVWRRPKGRRVVEVFRMTNPMHTCFSLAAALRPPGRNGRRVL